jgi:uncharacterized peroxidase-related enzyme
LAYIETIAESDAIGPLAELYKRFGNPDGTVDNVLKVHSINPASLEAHCALYVQSMHRKSPLSRAERELIGVIVSLVNGCTYCLEHHAAGLHRLLPDDRKHLVDEVKKRNVASLTDREQSLIGYAERLTSDPASIERGDIDAMRACGLSDREILDAAQTAAYFAYANRIVLGLGAAIESEDRIGQWPDA